MTKLQWWQASRFFMEGGIVSDFSRCKSLHEARELFHKRCGFTPKSGDMRDMLSAAGISLVETPAERPAEKPVRSLANDGELKEILWRLLAAMEKT